MQVATHASFASTNPCLESHLSRLHHSLLREEPPGEAGSWETELALDPGDLEPSSVGFVELGLQDSGTRAVFPLSNDPRPAPL